MKYFDIFGVDDAIESSVYIATQLNSKISNTEKGVVDGVATLDSFGKLTLAQLPAGIKEFEEFATFGDFPETGDSGVLYVDQSDGKIYGWSGTQYSEYSTSINLGILDTTAFRGDHGKIAYDHSQLLHDKALIGLNTTDDLPEGTTNLYWNTARIASIDHDNLLNSEAEQHRVINDSGTSETELFSASKISGELATKASSTHDHDSVYEPSFLKKTAFNLDFGETTNTVSEGDHVHNYLEDKLTTKGDLLYRNNTSTTRLPVGANNTFLGSDGTSASWKSVPFAITGTDTSEIDMTVAGQNVSAELKETTVTAGTYTNTNLTVDAKGRITNAETGTVGAGEVNTASNIGTAGVGVFKQKTDENLEFKNINAENNKVLVTEDIASNEIKIGVDETKINHDNLIGVTGTTNTHTQVDSHIADIVIHAEINDIGTASDEIWSSEKTNTAKADKVHTHVSSSITDLTTTVSGLPAVTANTTHRLVTTGNPHNVTKADLGLENVNNTSDINKPISTDTQTALDLKANTEHDHSSEDITDLTTTVSGLPAVTANTSHRLVTTGNPHNVTKADLGLENVNNTSDINKPISTDTQTALDLKANTEHDHSSEDITDLTATVSGLPAVTANTSHRLVTTGNPHNVTKADLGLENVNNTSDINKPISTDTQTALDLKSNILDIVNNLTTSSTNTPLSANMGVSLKEQIDAVVGGVILQGGWNANTNTPDITSETTTGFSWRVTVGGATELDGITDWKASDLAIKTTTGWVKIDNTANVLSVANKTGDVVLGITDITNLQTTLDSKKPTFSENTAFNTDFETSTTQIKENNTVSTGTSSNIARSDHVHPKDTSKANIANVLEKDNSTAYTPTADYHPSTKKYVDKFTPAGNDGDIQLKGADGFTTSSGLVWDDAWRTLTIDAIDSVSGLVLSNTGDGNYDYPAVYFENPSGYTEIKSTTTHFEIETDLPNGIILSSDKLQLLADNISLSDGMTYINSTGEWKFNGAFLFNYNYEDKDFLVRSENNTALRVDATGQGKIKTEIPNYETLVTGDNDIPNKKYVDIVSTTALKKDQNLADVANTQTSLNNLTEVSSATNEQVLTKDTTTGNALWKPASGGSVAGLSFELGEDMTAGDLVRIINEGGAKAKKIIGEAGFGDSVVFNSASASYISAIYDSTNNKIIIAYINSGNSYYGTAIVGTVNDTSITFGSPVVFNSADTSSLSVIHDSTNNKIIIAYRNSGNNSRGTAIVGTVNDTSITFGSPVVFNSSATYYVSATYDSTNNKIVIVYKNSGNSYYGTAIVGTVDDTSITFGSPVVFNSADTSFSIFIIHDSTNNKIIIAYRDDGNSNYGTAIVGTVDDTSITFGSPVVFNSASTSDISTTHDSTNNKIIIAYINSGNSSYGTAIVGTINDTSITFGSPVIFNSAESNYIFTTYDSTNNKIVIAYRNYGNSYYGTVIVGTVSGTSITFGSPVVFNSAITDDISTTYDSTNNKIIITYRNNGNSNYGTAIVRSSVGLFPLDTIGVLQETGTIGQTKAIKEWGGVSDIHTGLTPGQKQYIQESGTAGVLETENQLGVAISPTEILLFK